MIKMRIKNTKFYVTLSRLKRFFNSMDIRLRYIALPCLLAFIASLFEIIGFGLLIPVIRGIFQQNFTFVTGIPLLNRIIGPWLVFLGDRQSVIFGLLIAMIFLAIILKNVFLYAASLITSHLSQKLSSNLRKKIYARYMSFGKLFFDKTNAGYLYTVLLGFSGSIAGQINLFQSTLSALLFMIVYIVMMSLISWQLTLFVFITYPAFHYSISWIIKKIKKSSVYLVEAQTMLSKNISNSLSSIPLIKAYQSEEKEKRWFAHASEQLRSIEFSMAKKRALITPFQEVVSTSMLLGLVTAMTFLFVDARTGDISMYMVFFLLVRRVMANFSTINNLRVSLASIKGPLQEILKVFSDKDKFFVQCGAREFTGLKESIKFDKLTFTYPGGITALKDITLAIDKGRITAVVGASGAGKTTLISLIMRFYDISPEKIKIDGIDIREFSLGSLMSRIALVSQETFIINASLRANITYGLEGDITDELINNAVRLSEMSDFVAILPEGLDTNVGDRGVKLSGGEKQRVSIARAILRQAEIIILDEATSSLDSITESLIQKALAELVKDRTTIVIAHRLSTIKNADNIIVLEKGKVAEEGSLNALIDKQGKFFEFWQEQKFF